MSQIGTDYMLMFSLGPVQPFIAQARKTRDLWQGSLLLSLLMQAAMRDISDDFVFPAQRTVEKVSDIPNKYVALFASAQAAREAAEKSIARIRATWEDICETVWKEIIARAGDDGTRKIWDRQTNFGALFEIYWVIEPERGRKYSEWLEGTEQTLEARKRQRDFVQRIEPGEKSSISGEREALHTRHNDARAFWRGIARSRSPRDIDHEGKERLDAIDTIKRFAMIAEAINLEGINKEFPSTSSIAAASFVESLLTSQLATHAPRSLREWQEATGEPLDRTKEAGQAIPYLDMLAKAPERSDLAWLLQRDGDLYFQETLTPSRLKQSYDIADEQRGEKIAKGAGAALRSLLKATEAEGIAPPTPYYSILKMDGDNMGILLSGSQGKEEHQTISGALSEFARGFAPQHVEGKYPARLVYAGGDDVLAFAPLVRDQAAPPYGNIFELADKLQSGYKDQLIAKLFPHGAHSEREQQRQQGITASAGIVIAHNYIPLSYALQAVDDAEKAAKKRYGRDALVVTLLRRSGEQTQVGCHWRYSGLAEMAQPAALFTRFYRLLKSDDLSPSCIYLLLEEAPGLIGLEQEALAAEIRRILKRQLKLATKDQTRQEELQKEVGQLAADIADLACRMDGDGSQENRSRRATDLQDSGPRAGIVETSGWLLVMAFLARKEQEQN
jgi:CRISPR-associated protein Cmr2